MNTSLQRNSKSKKQNNMVTSLRHWIKYYMPLQKIQTNDKYSVGTFSVVREFY